MSDSRIELHRRRLANEDTAVEVKRCTKCGEIKSVEQFYKRKTKLKSGVIRLWPESSCAECCRKRRQARERREKEAGIDDAARQRERYRNLSPNALARRRARQRAWTAAKRREEGIPPRNFTKSRTPRSPRLLTEPIAQFIEARPEGRTEMAAMCGVEERRLLAIEGREFKKTDLEIVDAILQGLDCTDAMNELYPVEEEPAGWGILDPQGVLEHYRDSADATG